MQEVKIGFEFMEILEGLTKAHIDIHADFFDLARLAEDLYDKIHEEINAGTIEVIHGQDSTAAHHISNTEAF